MNQDGPLPLYEQIRRAIISEIDAGRLAEGAFLQPEPELCAAYGVSRITLRRAVTELCAEGRLIRQQGRGTFVAPRKLQQAISLSGFSETIDGLGRVAGHRALSRNDQPNAPDIQDRLQAKRLIRFDRLLEADVTPMTLEALWFDAERFSEASLAVNAGKSFFGALQKSYGIVPVAAERQIDVGFAGADERQILSVGPAQPVYRIEKTVFDKEGAALSHSRLVTPCHLVTLTLRSEGSL